jgi:diguanylate cyclase (GGDEF)-like protein/PAS domain S-box-containing protein
MYDTWEGANERIAIMLKSHLVILLMGVVYVVQALSDLLAGWPPHGHSVFDLVAGIGFLAAGWSLRREVVPGHLVLPLLRTLAALMTLRLNLEWWSTSTASMLGPMLAIVAGSCIGLSRNQWFSLVIGPVCLSWAIFSLVWLTPRQHGSGLLALGATSAATLTLQWARARMAKLRIADPSSGERSASGLNERERFLMAGEATQDGLWFWDLRTGSFSYNASYARLLLYEPDELRGDVEEWFSRVHPGYIEDLREDIAKHLEGKVAMFSNEHRLLRHDGGYIWVSARGTCQRDASGKPISLSGSLRDMTSVINAGRTSLHDSYHDKLTNLPNRGFLMARLAQLTKRKADMGRQAPIFALLFLDLDRFKVINDSLGHLAGDQLLLGVADRLRRCVRPTDMVSRFAGDEFAVLLEEVANTEEALNTAHRIRDALAQPHDLGGKEVISGASIGVVMGHRSENSVEELIHAADTAMYRAKSQRRGQVQLYDDTLRAANSRILDLQNDLARAIEREQLVLHFQPFVSLATGKIQGVEALVRWQRRPDELIGPSEFIPLAEEMGVIHDIGDWVLRNACAQSTEWRQQGLPPVRVSINISVRQLQEPDFSSRVRAMVRETGLEEGLLELELTESTLIHAVDRAPETLHQLAGIGIRTSVDDFGTGYSSLNYLRQFSFQTLKIDRCFVADLATDNRTRSIAKGLITLAHDLKMRVIAEGVERREQLRTLSALQCDDVQGYLISPPLPAKLLAAGLRVGKLPRVVEWAQAAPNDVLRLGDMLTANQGPAAKAAASSSAPSTSPAEIR